MIVSAKCLFSEKFAFNGVNYVKIDGVINGKGIFSTSVNEKLVPDSIEGKAINMEYDIGIDNKKKPYLKLIGIKLA